MSPGKVGHFDIQTYCMHSVSICTTTEFREEKMCTNSTFPHLCFWMHICLQAAGSAVIYIALVSTLPKKYVDVLHKRVLHIRAVQLGTSACQLDA